MGDIDVEAAVAAAARTFGALPERGAAEVVAERLAVKLVTGLHDEATVPTELPQALLFMAVPTSDGRDAKQRRQLSLLGGVVNDRLRVEVREKLGTSYSPNARSQVSQVFPGVGFILLNATADPGLTGKVLETCLTVCDSLSADGVTAEELERQREPILKQLRDQLRRNNYWLSALGECQTRAGALDDIRSLEADYQAITPETLCGAREEVAAARARELDHREARAEACAGSLATHRRPARPAAARGTRPRAATDCPTAAATH